MTEPRVAPAGPTRRVALRMLSVAALGLATGCAPLRIALRWSPAEFRDDPAAVDRVLRAFVATVLPGTELGDDAARVLLDDAYPFAPYAATFTADLSARGARRFGSERFDSLGADQRTAVVESGLRADTITRKLYTGAIFLTQISFYAGTHHDAGCPAIGFEGSYRPRPRTELTYPDPDRFLPHAATETGNPA